MKLITSIAVLFLLFSCTKDQESAKIQQPKIVVTTPIIAYFTQQISKGISHYKIALASKTEALCTHDLNLSAQEIQQVCKAKMIISAGAGLDPFMQEIKKICPKVPSVEVISPCADLKNQEGIIDPHAWLGKQNTQCILQQIEQSLSKFDSSHAGHYLNNRDAYAKLVDEHWSKLQSRYPEFATMKAISFHGAFGYLAKEFGIQIIETLPEDSEHSKPSAQKIAQLITKIRSKNIQYLFVQEQELPDLAKTIATETNITIVHLYTMNSALEKTNTAYQNTLTHNIKMLSNAYLSRQAKQP